VVDIVTLGELLIDMFPSEIGKPLAEVHSFLPKPGGAPANVAVAARRLGSSSAFIGKVGQDIFGDSLKATLDAEGVDIRGVRFDLEARTTMAIIAMPDENSAEFVFYRNPGADQRLMEDELDLDLLKAAKVFHFGSLSLSDEPARTATLRAVEIARMGGSLISYDVNYRPTLWKRPAEALEQAFALLPKIHLLKLNQQEAALLSGMVGITPANLPRLEEAAIKLLDQGPSLVVITFGKAGSYFQVHEGGGHVPPFTVNTVDAIGCGDAFMAGVLTQLIAAGSWQSNLRCERLFEILRYANAVGALTSLQHGVIPALPTTSQVADFLRQYIKERPND
jgi:fructokinase